MKTKISLFAILLIFRTGCMNSVEIRDQNLGTISGDENWMELSFQDFKLVKLTLI